MSKRIFLSIILMSAGSLLFGQEISLFLQKVAGSNPEIISYQKLLEARKTEARTDLTPPDPFISFGYMPGKTDNAGIKKIWSVTQSFSFPTKYITLKNLSREKIILAEQEFDLIKLNILLAANDMVFDLIYNKKMLEMLKQRKEVYDRLKSGWQKMLAAGETSVLDYNKILYELSSLNLKISRTETEIAILGERLLFMSGYVSALPSFTEYPDILLRDFEKIVEEKSALHPEWILPETEYQISLKEAKLSRTGRLPEFQAGYGSEIIPGETFTGPFAGFTIPLWSNSNKIKSADAMAEHLNNLKEAKLLELKTRVRTEFGNSSSLARNISEVREILNSVNDNYQLNKALTAGEISLNDYFLYLEASFGTEERLLDLENEYYKSLSSLYDHDLLQNLQISGQ